MTSSPVAACSALLLNAFVWGVSWLPFRHLQSLGWHPLWSTAFIYACALLVVAAFAQRQTMQIVFTTPGLWALAVASGLTNVGFNWAVSIGDVVRVVLLFYLMPAWSTLLAWPLLGERPSAQRWLRLLLAASGVLLVLKTPEQAWPVPVDLSDWLALFAGMCFALNNILLRKHATQPSAARMQAMFAGGACLSAIAAASLPQIAWPAQLALSEWMFALALAAAFLISNMALQYGAARLAASTTALVMLTEILFATSSSWFLGAADITPRMLIGGALVIAAAVWAAVSD